MTEGMRRTRRPRRAGVLTAVLALAGTACGPAGRETETPESAPWTQEGLEEQPLLQRLRAETPGSLGYEPGTTPWREVADSTPGRAGAAGGPDTPGELLARVALAAGLPTLLGDGAWEETMRVWSPADDRAIGVVLQWGLMDDAVAGRDLRVTMRRGERGWEVVGMEERFHCRRGVTADGRCQ